MLREFSETYHERTDKEDGHNRDQKPARNQDPPRWRPLKNHGSCQDDKAEHAYQHSEWRCRPCTSVERAHLRIFEAGRGRLENLPGADNRDAH